MAHLLRNKDHALRLKRTLTTTASTNPAPVHLTLTPQTLHSYLTTAAPTSAQLRHSNHLFTLHAPTLLYSHPAFRSLPLSPNPELCFLGRSNVGKSSLLNALFNRPRSSPARTSKTPGRTRTINGFGIGAFSAPNADTEKWKGLRPGAMVVVDMPGYGMGSREEWGREVTKYLEGRRQLRRTFLVVDAEHGLKRTDRGVVELLRGRGVSFQVVLGKVDKILNGVGGSVVSAARLERGLFRLREVVEEVREGLRQGDGRLGTMSSDILCVSAEMEGRLVGAGPGKLGIDAVRWAAVSAAGLDVDELGNKRGLGNTVLDHTDYDTEVHDVQGESRID